MAQDTISNYLYCRNIHNQIDGGALSFSSSTRLITSCTFNANGVKTEVLHSPPPWNNTVLGVPIHRNTYTIHIQLHIKISKFCRSVPRSIIYFERSRPSPSASMNFSCQFSALSLSRSLGTLRLLPSSCSLIGQSRRK